MWKLDFDKEVQECISWKDIELHIYMKCADMQKKSVQMTNCILQDCFCHADMELPQLGNYRTEGVSAQCHNILN